MRYGLVLLSAGITAILAMLDPAERVKSMLWDSDGLSSVSAIEPTEPTKWIVFYDTSETCWEAPASPAEVYLRFKEQGLNPRIVDKGSRVDLESTEKSGDEVIIYFRNEAACETFRQSIKAKQRDLDKYR